MVQPLLPLDKLLSLPSRLPVDIHVVLPAFEVISLVFTMQHRIREI